MKQNTPIETDPMSAASPELDAAAVAALTASIARSGQLVPILVYRGKILDGRKRAAACQALGTEPLLITIPDGALAAHYTTDQRAIYAASLATRAPIALRAAAKALGVHQISVSAALKVRQQCAPEIIQALESGEISLYAAQTIMASTPKEAQAATLAKLLACPKYRPDRKTRRRFAAEVRQQCSPEVIQALESGEISLAAAHFMIGVSKEAQAATLAKMLALPNEGAQNKYRPDPKIRRLFADLDRRHFAGSLGAAGCHVETYPLLTPDRLGRFFCYNLTIEINLAKLKSSVQVRHTLLHEMAHATLYLNRQKEKGEHGAVFWREMERLYLNGESCLEREVAAFRRKIAREAAEAATRLARREFKKQTGHPRGWAGHVIDYIVPLASGGAVAASNMRWLTLAAFFARLDRLAKQAVNSKIAAKSGRVKELAAHPDGTVTAVAGDARKRQTKSRTRALLRGPKQPSDARGLGRRLKTTMQAGFTLTRML